jgi:hypothetical protein
VTVHFPQTQATDSGFHITVSFDKNKDSRLGDEEGVNRTEERARDKCVNVFPNHTGTRDTR